MMNESKIDERNQRELSVLHPASLQHMDELKLMIEGLRTSKESNNGEDALETPYVSYEEVYPPNKGMNLSLVKQSEKKFWQELVDSNIRAGTIACLWCLKAQAIKRLSTAFNKWKVFSAVKTQELIVKQTNALHKSEVSSVIDYAISIIRLYKEGGVMNQINHSNDWKNETTNMINFPWEERRQLPKPPPTGGLTAASVIGLSDSTVQYLQQTVPHSPSSPQRHHFSLRETMEATEKEWNFVRTQMHGPNNNGTTTDADTERDRLLALSYDIIKRAEKDRIHSPSFSDSSPRHQPLQSHISKHKHSSLQQEAVRESKSRASPKRDSQSPKRTESPQLKHFTHASSKIEKEEKNYHANEPTGVYELRNQSSPVRNNSPLNHNKASTNRSHFPENTLQIPPAQPGSPHSPALDYHNIYPDQFQENRKETVESEKRVRGRTMTPSRSAQKSLPSTTSKRSVASASPSGRRSYSDKTLMDMIKFRKTKEGNYVKDLFSPREESSGRHSDVSAIPGGKSSLIEESGDFQGFSELGNLSATSSMMPKSGTKGRSTSPYDKPRYLLPTNSYRKKMLTAEEAQMIKEKHERERRQKERRGRANHSDPYNHHHQQQHDTSTQNDFSHSSIPPPSFSSSGHYHPAHQPPHQPMTNSNYPSQFNSRPYISAAAGHVGSPLLSSAAPPQQLSSVPGRDPEYEYYKQLVKEQQQQFLNYQAQVANRQSGLSQLPLQTNPTPISSSISTTTGPPVEHLLNKSYLPATTMQATNFSHGLHSTNGSNDQLYTNQAIENIHPVHSQLPNDSFQYNYFPPPSESYTTNPNQSINHNPTNYAAESDAPIYSLNPNYYQERNIHPNVVSEPFPSDAYQSSNPANGVHSNGHGSASGSSRKGSSTKKSSPNKKMDKAQRMLLYGVLHDALDAKKAWEKNLRR